MKRAFLIIFFCFSGVILAASANAFSAPKIQKFNIKKVMLVVAMDNEAKPIISDLSLHEINGAFPNLPMKGYSGKYNNINLLLIMNGQDPIYKVQNIGTQASTLTTYVGIQYFHPDLIISIGTAGGIEQNGAKLKDIYVSKRIYFFDRRLESENYRNYGLGGYHSILLSPIDKRLGLKQGIVCSGDSFDDNPTDLKMMLQEHCAAIDMEAAGVAWVSMLTRTPMFAMKGITNFSSNKYSQNQYKTNVPIVTAKLSNNLKKFLDLLASG